MRRVLGVILSVTASAACTGDLDDPGSATDTDQPEFCVGGCNGVQVYCENPPAPDGSNDNRNFWWVTKGTPGSTCEDGLDLSKLGGIGCNEEEGDYWCCPTGADNLCFCKTYTLNAQGLSNIGDMGPLCVGLDYPAPVDEFNDWDNGSYPTIDDDIRGWCSDRCGMESQLNGDANPAQPECLDANWAGHKTLDSWMPSDGHNCFVTMMLNEDDPDGSEVPWDLVGGPSTPIPLSCDLTDDCADWFYPSVGAFVVTPGIADFIEFETRTAHYLGVDGTGSQLAIDMPGNFDDTEDMFGMAEYSALDCGEAVCPFFLANLSAYNTTDTWSIRVDTVTGKENKDFSNLQVDLAQSTLGIHHTSLDVVAFAPGALRFIVEFTVEGTGIGAGTHYTMVENEDYAFADYDSGALDLSHTFAVQGGEGTLNVSVVPDEHPPVPSHDLSSPESCDSMDGLLLRGRSLSSDPDNDIALEMWWIDGSPCIDDCAIPLGVHDVALEVWDARGAMVLGETRTIEITVANPCAV